MLGTARSTCIIMDCSYNRTAFAGNTGCSDSSQLPSLAASALTLGSTAAVQRHLAFDGAALKVGGQTRLHPSGSRRPGSPRKMVPAIKQVASQWQRGMQGSRGLVALLIGVSPRQFPEPFSGLQGLEPQAVKRGRWAASLCSPSICNGLARLAPVPQKSATDAPENWLHPWIASLAPHHPQTQHVCLNF